MRHNRARYPVHHDFSHRQIVPIWLLRLGITRTQPSAMFPIRSIEGFQRSPRWRVGARLESPLKCPQKAKEGWLGVCEVGG